LLQDSAFFEIVRYYSEPKNSPSIKTKIDIDSSEEYKDASVDSMLKLSNDLKNTKSRKDKISRITAFTQNHVSNDNKELFVQIITFQTTLGVTSYSIKKKSGDLRFM
jgi:hypothetical protein